MTNPYGRIALSDPDAEEYDEVATRADFDSSIRSRSPHIAVETIPGQNARPVQLAQPAVRASSGRWAQARPFVTLVGAACAILILYLLISTLAGFLGMKADDLQYGRPRTYQLDAFVGHDETPGNPTHFIAINLNHQVVIIELPGGDVSKARAISGPYLFGDGEDLTPVTLEVRDVNGDNKPDLLVDIKNEQVVYINSGSDFHLMSDSERAGLGSGAAK